MNKRTLIAMTLITTGLLAWTTLNAKDKSSAPVGETKATAQAKKSAAATSTPTAANLSVTSAETKSPEQVMSAKSATDDQCTFKTAADDKCKTEPAKKKK